MVRVRQTRATCALLLLRLHRYGSNVLRSIRSSVLRNLQSTPYYGVNGRYQATTVDTPSAQYQYPGSFWIIEHMVLPLLSRQGGKSST